MSEVLDAAVLNDLIEGVGAEAAMAIIRLFVGECRELTAAIAAPGAHPAAIERAAHSLKSSAGQLGANALSEAALAVESAARAAPEALPELVATLARCATQTETALTVRLA